MNADFQPTDDQAATFRFGEFVFDCGSRLLTRGGVKRHLSLKAQQLLQVLLAARPRALPREELYDVLWPSTFVCESNLASLVNEVRRALGDDARTSQYIRTVHGFGYAFCGAFEPAVAMNLVAATLYCEGKSYPLCEGENVVGRGQDCRVVLTAPTISRRHTLITIHDDSCSIMDLGSRNGTFVDGQSIGHQPVMVWHHAQIAFSTIHASIDLRKIPSASAPLISTHEFLQVS
jgi:DNA-binding winged helix-turn-helix (wHTH) protein